ncbi:MAG: hypothetical protein ACKVZJ_13050 [Phycisphaerales bacterium]
MPALISRRDFSLLALPAAGLALAAFPGAALAADPAGSVPVPSTPVPPTPAPLAPTGVDDPEFPSQPRAMAEKVVGLSHRDLEGVKALVEARPSLANAAVDLGFGDWETALGAASHTGRIEIAEYLLSKGARPDVFTFAMMGNLAAVKAAVDAAPGVQRTRGPHGISLLRHAQAGGERAKPVLDYLAALGDADPRYTDLPLDAATKQAVIGVYTFGPGATQRFEIGEGMGGLTIKRTGGSARRLFQQSPLSFHPAGAPAVSVVFVVEGDRGARVTVTDHDIVVVGKRA